MLKGEGVMKKFISILIVFSLTFLFSSILYAQDSSMNDGKSMLNLSNKELGILAEEFEYDLINKHKERLIESRIDNEEEYNIIGELSLNDDFSRMQMTTFADSKTFSGQARVGTQIGITVFSLNEQGEVSINQQKSIAIGMSRLFDESISLSNFGDNYILIVAQNTDEDNLKYKLFNIVRLKEEKKMELENMKIDFFENVDDKDSNSFFDQLSQSK